MKAVIFKEPHKIAVEDRPIPKIKESTDVIVKVIYSALCGSELHVFRVSEGSAFPMQKRADGVHRGINPVQQGLLWLVCLAARIFMEILTLT